MMVCSNGNIGVL